jgi:hypothetical protein
MNELTRMKSPRTEQHVKWEAFVKRLDDEPNMVLRDVLCIQACSVLRGDISRLWVDNDSRILPEIKDFYHDGVK